MLDTINSVLREHKAIQADIDLFSVLVREWEDLLPSTAPSPSMTEMRQALADKQLNLLHAISNLREGFISHHVNEEHILEPVLGNLLELALIDKHKLIVTGLVKAEKVFLNANLQEPLPDSANLKQELESLCLMISEHASLEDNILIFARRYLEKSPVRT